APTRSRGSRSRTYRIAWSESSSDLPGARTLRPRRAATRPVGALPPLSPGASVAVLGVELLARRGVGVDGLVRLGHCPEVLLPAPAAVARVLQDRDTGEIDRAGPGGVIATVLHVDHHPARGLVDGVPLVGRVELRILSHDRLDPGADLLPPVHRAQH